jgi:hypothetical protein
MTEDFDNNPIASRYKLRRTSFSNFEIVDQYEKKFIECELLNPTSKMNQDLANGLDVPWYSLKDSGNTPMGEITVQVMDRYLHSYTIKNSLGEAVATVSIQYPESAKKFQDDKNSADVIIKTPTTKFIVVNVEKTEEKRNWRGKPSTKKYSTKLIVMDEKENHCFSIIPKVKYGKDGLFEINIFEDFLDLNPNIICTISFFISSVYW